MLRNHLIFWGGILCLWICPLQAQNIQKPEIDLDSFIQELFPVQDEDLNYEDIYETLFLLYSNPLNLNRCTRDELQSLFILSEKQLNSFFEYREKNGNFLSIYELQAVPDLDLITINKILPFVSIEDLGAKSQPLLQRILAEKNNYLLLRYSQTLEEKKGFTEEATPSQKYLGSPGKLYARFRISHVRDFSLGFTLEKDDGEQYIWDPDTRRYGMDYVSYHAFFQNKGRFKAIALGDYQIQFGQGLLLAGGFGLGKGSESVQAVRRSNLGIRPFTSVLESGFFRGGAVTYNVGPIDITGFYSRIRRDGTLSEATDTTEAEFQAFIETLQSTGLHRTENEINAKGRFKEQTVGGNLLFRNGRKNLEIGAIFIHTNYNLPFVRGSQSAKDSIVDQFEFSGKTNYNIGLNFNYNWQNFSFFGEGARSKSGGIGFLGGFVSSLSDQVEMSMLYRSYDRDFHTFFGSAFGEGTRNINESGIYWGIKITPIVRKLQIAAYYDWFKFPWLRFRIDAPSDGYEFLSRVSYSFSRKIKAYAQFRQEVKDRNINSEDSQTAFREIFTGTKRNFLINFDYQAEKIFRVQTRVQFSTFDFNSVRTKGFALVQDFGFDFGKLRLDFRYSLFDTDDFDNRQYVYEKDVLWSFSIPAYNGRGIRSYALLRYQITRKIDVWLRYARFDYQNQDTVSSGGEETQGNTRSEIRAQVRFEF
ncbi:MAG: helix-hairpin-helix domain-containing protein [Microscillaceae bacterium]|nr:helix-hairpin-helix domain-containing protein [Microscillaceae bacterium]